MIIKKIILENIRSYKYQEVIFEKGKTLLAGDIGSGKTSILLGIEFGLFGLQPGQRGNSLLRNGENEGRVILEVQIEDKNLIIERTLRKSKTISQDYCSIEINGEKKELSVSELKSKILEILNYPLEFSKKQNLLYKFTVYTPQEEMKQIILEDKETRLNTLRHVFGIDKYKKILENVGILKIYLREEKKLLEGVTSSIDEDKKNLEEKERQLEEKKDKLFPLSEDFLIKEENRIKKELEKKEIEEKIKEKFKLKQEFAKSQGVFISKKDTLAHLEKNIGSLKLEIEEITSQYFNPLEIQNMEEEILKKKKQKEKILENDSNLILKIGGLKSKLEEKEEVKRGMQDLKTCPTCKQEVDAIYRANVLNKLHNEINSGIREISDLERELNFSKDKIKKLVIEIELFEKKVTDLKIKKMKLDSSKEKVKKLEEMIKDKKNLEGDILFLKNHLDSLNETLFSFSKYDSIFQEKEKELALAQKEEKICEIKIAETKKEIQMIDKSIHELNERIKKIEGFKEKLRYLEEIETWILKKFIPVISFIEKNVLNSLKYEFSKLFSEWFGILVPENFSVKIGEDFSPIIEQKDYEIEYQYLSGGERTAIALAYRLALNQVINSLISKIKTKDIVILDEPTDGFSDEQLDKMREVLDQLNLKQLIIVSHEQKIEGFVENIIRFKKEHGESEKE